MSRIGIFQDMYYPCFQADYQSLQRPRVMEEEKAAELYYKLKKFLGIVAGYGNYLPAYSGQDVYPLAYRKKGHPPVCVTWNPKNRIREATFDEFLQAYNITIKRQF